MLVELEVMVTESPTTGAAATVTERLAVADSDPLVAVTVKLKVPVPTGEIAIEFVPTVTVAIEASPPETVTVGVEEKLAVEKETEPSLPPTVREMELWPRVILGVMALTVTEQVSL